LPDFPKIATPEAVWTYATRQLTGFTGTPRSDLVGVDETIYTRLDVAVSTRSSHTAGDIWAVTTRTLTAFTGTPRVDLLGEDADFEAGTATRKVRIDRLAAIEAQQTPTEGTASYLVTDTYPKTVTIIDTSTMAVAGDPHYVEGHIDLSPLASGEMIRVAEAISVVSPVSYKDYAREEYTGVVDPPLLFIHTKPGRYGIKIDLTMDTAPAADRSIPYQLFVRAVE